MIDDAELVAFLQWALPQRGFRWRGFRRVRSTVRKQLGVRLAQLGLQSLAEYRQRLERDPTEWDAFEPMCRIPISRFHRDRAVFEFLRGEILPERAREALRASRPVRVWSAGCASGEEPYTVAILWDLEVPHDTGIEILATDAAEHMLERARHGCYRQGSLRELAEPLRAAAFRREGDLYCLRDRHRAAVTFRCEDLRRTMPAGPFDVILCRYLAFNYFDEPTQRTMAERFAERLYPGGVLVIGAHDTLPEGVGLTERGPSVFG